MSNHSHLTLRLRNENNTTGIREMQSRHDRTESERIRSRWDLEQKKVQDFLIAWKEQLKGNTKGIEMDGRVDYSSFHDAKKLRFEF